jgi:hypothetical protein
MGRPQQDIVPDGSPTRLFALCLRDLRSNAGLTFEQLARRTGFSKTTVNDAMRGKVLPTRIVTLAIVGACGGNRERWAAFWRQVRRALDPDASAAPGEITPPPRDPPAGAGADAHGVQCPPGCARTEPHGWYTESVHTRVRLDTPTPEAIERRVIVATSDGLTRIPVAFSVPRHTPDTTERHGLDVSAVRGGRLELREHPYESFFRQSLVLPAPLPAGARHEYVLRLRIPLAQPMAPHFVHVPLTRSERFHLSVRFDPARPPRTVWQLAGVPPAVIYQRVPGTSVLHPDARGAVTVAFEEMRLGYGYGLCWQDEQDG